MCTHPVFNRQDAILDFGRFFIILSDLEGENHLLEDARDISVLDSAPNRGIMYDSVFFTVL